MADRDHGAEDKLSAFYRGEGWETREGVTEDARLFEDLRESAQSYVRRCRERVSRYIPDRGDNLLDMASGPIQYPEYLTYSEHFAKRTCVDLSPQALDAARAKIGDHGVFLCGNFLDIPLEANQFDCAISLHTIYHIDKDQQEAAVRKLVNVTRPGKPVIIIYSNPRPIPSLVRGVLRRLHVIPKKPPQPGRGKLYVHAHPLSWWKRFEDVAEVTIRPWRSFASRDQQALFPDGVIGAKMLDALFVLEDMFPRVFARLFQYPMIILRKRG